MKTFVFLFSLCIGMLHAMDEAPKKDPTVLSCLPECNRFNVNAFPYLDPTGHFVALRDNEGNTHIHNAETSQRMYTLPLKNAIILWSPFGSKLLAQMSVAETIYKELIWDRRTYQIKDLGERTVGERLFSFDDDLLLEKSFGKPPTVILIENNEEKILPPYTAEDTISHAQDPRGEYLITHTKSYTNFFPAASLSEKYKTAVYTIPGRIRSFAGNGFHFASTTPDDRTVLLYNRYFQLLQTIKTSSPVLDLALDVAATKLFIKKMGSGELLDKENKPITSWQDSSMIITYPTLDFSRLVTVDSTPGQEKVFFRTATGQSCDDSTLILDSGLQSLSFAWPRYITLGTKKYEYLIDATDGEVIECCPMECVPRPIEFAQNPTISHIRHAKDPFSNAGRYIWYKEEEPHKGALQIKQLPPLP